MTDVNDPAPNPHATAEEVQAAYADPKLANVLYHDWEAGTYDEKWSISYDERCISYATDVFNAVAGEDGQPYQHAMELGSGTGFFLAIEAKDPQFDRSRTFEFLKGLGAKEINEVEE